MKKQILLIAGSVVMLGAIFLMVTKLYKKGEAEKVTTAPAEQFVRPHAISKGEPNAKIVVTEFLDPECESCRGIFSFVEKMMEDYKGKIRLVVRYAPFHHNSRFAIKILEAARKQGKYWETLEVLYRHQPEWGDHHMPRPELIWTYLPEAGLDVEKIRADLDDPAVDELIALDLKDGEALGVRATPTFFVNGKPLEQFGPEFLRSAIEKEL